jgi:patatin-like phospholipase/acyl hydrolase
VAEVFKVLSIDGGGIRGIIPAMILAEIEDRTGKSIAEMFDLIAGTSTGGILALGLAMPGNGGKPRYKAEELIELYEKEGLRIFSRPGRHRIDSLEGIAEERYPSEGIEQVLEEYFGEVCLKDALTRVLITSYEIQLRLPFFFRSERAKASADYDFSMRQVARATSAAPTYFEPAKVEAEDPVDYYALVDGGVFANNPAMCVYVEARRILDAEDSPYPSDTDILVVSLGTGQLTDRLRYEEAAGWGLLGWARPIIDVVFDGVSDTVDFQLRELLSPSKNRPKRYYYRFQRELVEVSDAMDNVSPRNLQDLKLLAAAMIHDEGPALSELCERLTQKS